MVKYKIIDNFLEEEDFKNLHHTLTAPNNFQWFLNETVGTDNDKDKTHFYFCHRMYENDQSLSPFFWELHNIWKAFTKHGYNIRTMMRCKANLYTRTPEIVEHAMHTDFDFEHKAGLFL